jgi:hypothetical protein
VEGRMVAEGRAEERERRERRRVNMVEFFWRRDGALKSTTRGEGETAKEGGRGEWA